MRNTRRRWLFAQMTLMTATVTITAMTFPSETVAETELFSISKSAMQALTQAEKLLASLSKDSLVLDDEMRASVKTVIAGIKVKIDDDTKEIDYSRPEQCVNNECSTCQTVLHLKENDDGTLKLPTNFNPDVFKKDVLACEAVITYMDFAGSLLAIRETFFLSVDSLNRSLEAVEVSKMQKEIEK